MTAEPNRSEQREGGSTRVCIDDEPAYFEKREDGLCARCETEPTKSPQHICCDFCDDYLAAQESYRFWEDYG